MAHAFPVNYDIGLKVGKTFRTNVDIFDRTFKYNVRSESERNMAKTWLMQYKAFWDEKRFPPLTLSDTVLDIGAHVGFFSVPLSTQVGRIIAFEPAPANYTLLVRNLRLNGRVNVTTRQQAIAPSGEPRTLYLGIQGTSGHSIVKHKRGGVTVPVNCTAFDTVIADCGVTAVKLDAEGIEWELFQLAYGWSHIRAFVAELHDLNEHKRRLLHDFLKAQRYEHWYHEDNWFGHLVAWRN